MAVKKAAKKATKKVAKKATKKVAKKATKKVAKKEDTSSEYYFADDAEDTHRQFVGADYESNQKKYQKFSLKKDLGLFD